MAVDYTKTQRILLLIDLNPRLHLQDQELYIITILAAVKSLISAEFSSQKRLLGFGIFLDSNSDTHKGILYPFTIFSALLSIIDDESYTHKNEFGGDNLSPFVKKMDSDICKSNMSAAVGDVKRKKNKKDIHLFQDLTWNDFCKAASQSIVIKLKEVYFARECNSSKKLKFLKCWMKQIEKSSYCSQDNGSCKRFVLLRNVNNAHNYPSGNQAE